MGAVIFMNKVNHLGIIPDGSRRWARSREISLRDSYKIAMRNLVEILRYSYVNGIGSVSVYLLSKANLRRSPVELEAVAEAEEELLAEMLPPLAEEFAILVRVAGVVDLAPFPIRKGVQKLLDVAGEGAGDTMRERRLYLCIAYDPMDEIVAAMEKNNSIVMQSLWVPEKIDLVIRTGGALTLSDFLPLQCGYARVIFLDELFNDLSAERVGYILRDHKEQELKFGE